MLLIMSGAYLNSEFTAEFGRLPPSFLPVGNKRLFQWQLNVLRHVSDRITMTLPEDFVPTAVDQAFLADHGVELVRMPAGLSLGAGIVYCLNVCRAYFEPIHLLLGDTLVGAEGLDESDMALVAKTSEYYSWAEVVRDGNSGFRFQEGLPGDQTPREVLCGYFTFSDPSLLIESIVRCGNAFVAGVDLYASQRPLTLRTTDKWLDFGHVQLYYQSKSEMTTQRAFNHLQASRRAILKSSNDEDKIRAEAEWFETLPDDLRVYTPTYMGRCAEAGRFGYRTEYLRLSTLSELLVFGRLPAFVWNAILDGCDEFLHAAAGHRPADAKTIGGGEDYGGKTLKRLETYLRQCGDLDLDHPCRYGDKALPSLHRIVDICAGAVPAPAPDHVTIWHGDFCFSNIFYDFRGQQIKTIDPRGRTFDGRHSVFGDRRYDIAKLSHSIVGLYDLIIAGHYTLETSNSHAFSIELAQSREIGALQTLFQERAMAGIDTADPAIAAMNVMLFLSMLPLHADSPKRQRALLANGLRMFAHLDA